MKQTMPSQLTRHPIQKLQYLRNRLKVLEPFVVNPALLRTGREIEALLDFLRVGALTTWLGEDASAPAAAKAVLKTMEGVNWTAAPEPKKPRPPRKR